MGVSKDADLKKDVTFQIGGSVCDVTAPLGDKK